MGPRYFCLDAGAASPGHGSTTGAVSWWGGSGRGEPVGCGRDAAGADQRQERYRLGGETLPLA
eukprot:7736459-Pyramimonas_sp.AAC.1